jgi:hypothetical protein
MNSPRVFLYPGFVRRKSDGEVYYLGIFELAKIHGYKVQHCISLRSPEEYLKCYKPRDTDIHIYANNVEGYEELTNGTPICNL